MYVLYGGKFTRAVMVEMVLAEIGVPFELREVDTGCGEHRSEEFLKINPAGWVPALITPEGDALYETPAINLYLAERHAAEHLIPLSKDPARGRFLSAYFYLSGELEPAMKRYFFPHRYGDGEAGAPIVKAKAFEAARTCLKVIERRLSTEGPYHLEQRFSLADLVLAHWVATFEEQDVISDLPAVSGCVALVVERPRLAPVFEKQAAWMKELFELYGEGGGVR
ncbi:MAG: glutathione S-transferase family protein [Pseudomonadota bacterium]